MLYSQNHVTSTLTGNNVSVLKVSHEFVLMIVTCILSRKKPLTIVTTGHINRAKAIYPNNTQQQGNILIIYVWKFVNAFTFIAIVKHCQMLLVFYPNQTMINKSSNKHLR